MGREEVQMGGEFLPESEAGDEATSETTLEENFGRWLTRAREARGLSLDEVAHITKIRKAILEGLEHGSLEGLPERVFINGYVRSYASAIGADPSEALLRFERDFPEQSEDDLAELEARGKGYGWIGPLAAVVVLLLVLAFIVTQI